MATMAHFPCLSICPPRTPPPPPFLGCFEVSGYLEYTAMLYQNVMYTDFALCAPMSLSGTPLSVCSPGPLGTMTVNNKAISYS